MIDSINIVAVCVCVCACCIEIIISYTNHCETVFICSMCVESMRHVLKQHQHWRTNTKKEMMMVMMMMICCWFLVLPLSFYLCHSTGERETEHVNDVELDQYFYFPSIRPPFLPSMRVALHFVVDVQF